MRRDLDLIRLGQKHALLGLADEVKPWALAEVDVSKSRE
jgi:hypothetical protein